MRGELTRTFLGLLRKTTKDQSPDGSNQSAAGLVSYSFVRITAQNIQLAEAGAHVRVQLSVGLRMPRCRGNPVAISVASHHVDRFIIERALQRFDAQNLRRRVTLPAPLLNDLQPVIKGRSNV